MKDFDMPKIYKSICLAVTLALAACNNATPPQTNNSNQESAPPLPPLIDYFSCLPQETALVAAHRGTAERSAFPENSMSALKELIKNGYLVSEVDVAGLKDDVHILYHDGVWDEKSTGKGPVASTTWNEAEKYLLDDTNGSLSSDRPVKLEDYLAASKGKIYLEIDFKSSAKYETVLNLIRKHHMSDQVILISYNERQTKKLTSLAPDMMLSIGSNEALGQTRFKPGQVAAWIGYKVDNQQLIKSLRDKNIPILGRIKKTWNKQAATAADLLVSDNVFNEDPIAGLTKANKIELESCLSKL